MLTAIALLSAQKMYKVSSMFPFGVPSIWSAFHLECLPFGVPSNYVTSGRFICDSCKKPGTSTSDASFQNAEINTSDDIADTAPIAEKVV